MSVYRGGLTCLSETFSIPVTEKVYKWINNHFFVFTHVEMARVHVLRSEKRSLHTQPTLIKVMGSKFHFATEISRNAFSRPNISFFWGGVAGRGVGLFWWRTLVRLAHVLWKHRNVLLFRPSVSNIGQRVILSLEPLQLLYTRLQCLPITLFGHFYLSR